MTQIKPNNQPLSHCENCHSRISQEQLQLIKKKKDAVFCSYCGKNLYLKKNFNDNQNSKKEFLKDENTSNINQYKRESFEYYITIFAGRIIYDSILQANLSSKPIESYIDKLAHALRIEFSEKPLNQEWLGMFRNNNRKRFKKRYREFQAILKRNVKYQENFLIYSHTLIKSVLDLKKYEMELTNLKGIKRDITEDLINRQLFERDKRFPDIFKQNLIIALSRLIYIKVKIIAQKWDAKISLIDLDQKVIVKMADSIKYNIITNAKINPEFLNKLYGMTLQQFNDAYQNLRAELNASKIYAESFGYLLQQLVKNVNLLLSGKREKASLTKLEQVTVYELKNLESKLQNNPNLILESSERKDRGGGDNWSPVGGVTGDTKIQLADNRSLSIIQLLEECKAGKENFCFSLDSSGNIVIDKIEAVRQIKYVSKLLKITLDNFETVNCDYNCNFLSRDNDTVEASILMIQQSLMPLYIDYAKNVSKGHEAYKRHVNLEEYLVVYNPYTGLYDFIHSIADAYNLKKGIYTKKDGPIRHHANFVKYNNNPTNIRRKFPLEHLKIHSEVASENITKLHQDPEFQERHKKRASKNMGDYVKSKEFYEMTRDAGQRGKEYLIKYNKSEKGREKSSEIGREGRMNCQECGQEVFGRAKMNEHYKKKHLEKWDQWQKNFQKAGLEYARSDKNRKAMAEKNKGKMTCHECGKIIDGISELRKHYAKEHNDPLPCPFCGRLCQGKNGLSTHIRYCPKNPDRVIREKGYYPCPNCERAFDTQGGLAYHITRGHKEINHKIIKIEFIECESIMIYNLELKDYGSFGLAAGVFIKSLL